jgi:hypothetical protein
LPRSTQATGPLIDLTIDADHVNNQRHMRQVSGDEVTYGRLVAQALEQHNPGWSAGHRYSWLWAGALRDGSAK